MKYYFCLSGKAEAGSAGEQPARNNLIDWNGQKVGVKNFDLFLCSIPRGYAFKKLIHKLELQKTCFYQQYNVCISVLIYF